MKDYHAMSFDFPRVGAGVMVFKDGKVLLGKRKGSTAAGDWGFPGGMLEVGESFEDAVQREVWEEAGLKIENIRFLYIANVQKYLPKHFVFVGFVADWKSGEPVLKEPEKCEGWEWHDLAHLPEGEKTLITTAAEAYFAQKPYFSNV